MGIRENLTIPNSATPNSQGTPQLPTPNSQETPKSQETPSALEAIAVGVSAACKIAFTRVEPYHVRRLRQTTARLNAIDRRRRSRPDPQPFEQRGHSPAG